MDKLNLAVLTLRRGRLSGREAVQIILPQRWSLVFRRMSLRAYAYLSLTATAEEAREASPLKNAAPDTSSASAFFRGIYRTGIDQLRLKRRKLGASNTNRKEPATVLG
jgi:hypothetical protein